MNKYGTVDFAPGENHITLRYPNKNYYVPAVFHNAPTMNRVVPLFISDINTSQSVREIYGPIDGHLRYLILVNNYPVSKLSVFGKIVCEKYFNFDVSLQEPNPRNFFWLSIDDFSGKKLLLDIKVSEEVFREGGLSIDGSYGKLVNIVCYVERATNKIRVFGEKIHTLGDQHDLHVELEYWQKALSYRNTVLKVPWVYTPPPTTEQDVVSRLSSTDSRRKQQRNKLKIADSIEIHQLTEDSLLLNRSVNVKLSRKRLRDVNSTEKGKKGRSRVMKVAEDKLSTDNELEILDMSNLNEKLQNIHVDSDVEILDIRPVQIIPEFQIYLETIKWIIRRRFRNFRLIELYKDPAISQLLETLANLKIACTHLSPSPLLDSIPPQDSFSALKGTIFHRIRHILQIQYKLITVSKGQNVALHHLKLLYKHLKTCLIIIRDDMANKQQVKLLNVKSYLELISKEIIDINIDYRLINGMVDYIITNEFKNRTDWLYDRKNLQWSYKLSTHCRS
jgi:hypothetical protein